MELGVWDLVIYDRAVPAKMPRTNTFFIGCLPPGGGWKAKPEVTLPQIIDAAVSNRLMQWVDINEIQKVITATPLVVPSGGTVLIDSDAGPLLAIAPREGFEDLVLGMVLVRGAGGGRWFPGRLSQYRLALAGELRLIRVQPPHGSSRRPGPDSLRFLFGPECP